MSKSGLDNWINDYNVWGNMEPDIVMLKNDTSNLKDMRRSRITTIPRNPTALQVKESGHRFIYHLMNLFAQNVIGRQDDNIPIGEYFDWPASSASKWEQLFRGNAGPLYELIIRMEKAHSGFSQYVAKTDNNPDIDSKYVIEKSRSILSYLERNGLHKTDLKEKKKILIV